MTEMLYADLALNLPTPNTYQYIIPSNLQPVARVGALALAPIQNRRVAGCIVGISGEKKCESLKELKRILSPDFAIEPELIELSRWMSRYYFCSLGEALACVSFLGFNDCRQRMEKWVRVKDLASLKRPDALDAFPTRQADVLRFFLQRNTDFEKLGILRGETGVSPSTIRALAKKGAIEIFQSTVERGDEYPHDVPATIPFELNEQQSAAFAAIHAAISESRYKTFLLNGVTGSGKTEIYLQSLDEVLRRGGQGIVLVPEIALTPQTVERFRGRFGDRIGVYHSQLTLGQKYDMWRGIVAGKIQCLVGARSAVFAPFPRLGLIVVDEEHETTYKQNDTPRYHARDVAVVRGMRTGAVVILGSATPALESWHNAHIGKFTLLTLPERIRQAPLPSVTLVDLGEELIKNKNAGIFSLRLMTAIEKRLEAGEQVILFLNRRGFANFILCPACHKSISCEHCSITMTYHKVGERLVCHYCGEQKAVPSVCPQCGHENLLRLGVGTQRLEEELAEKFPAARILRMDADSLGSRKSFLEKWRAITKGEVDILFGTQILAKGFDLAPVTLVGVISADHALFLPDFRSSERTFSILTQVAGRAGRGDKPGEVIIQTYLPRHYSIVDALAQDYAVFAKRELAIRRAIRFPPYFRLISVLFQGKKGGGVSEHINRFGNLLHIFGNQMRLTGVSILGPAPSPIEKLGDHYRYRLLLRSEGMGDMQRLLRAALEKYHSLKLKGACRIIIDVDPQDML
ncbi:MAG: primosomal protein N' [Candidatus Sumerlaeota bacterium]|nr:primosomal protein N' [Candidatus Sumerlaeota bacterium]